MSADEAVVVFAHDYSAERLRELGARMPVWIVDSASNKEVVQGIWNDQVPAHVTLFDQGADCAKPEDQLQIVEVIEEHTDEYEGCKCLEIIGLELTDAAKEVLQTYGFDQFEVITEGFKALGRR